MDEVTGEWRKLHIEELNDLCFSPNIVRVIKSRRVGWAGHIARMGERTGVYRVLVGRTRREETTWMTQAMMGGFSWIFRKWDMGVWIGSRRLTIGIGWGTCECGNEPSGSIKCGEFLDLLRTG